MQNGKTQPNNMNDSELNTNEQPQNERIAYSIPEAADMLGLDYFSVYRLVQRGKLKACRALRGKFLISRTELFRLLNTE
jgi:excisionase family DNA binding protein